MSLKQIQTVISEQTGISKKSIQLDTSIEELQIDEMDLSDIYIELEDLFDIEISEDAIYEFETISDILAYIEVNTEADVDDEDY